MTNTHSFHIPVMGIGYTIDSPLKVSRYGIDSVISLGDDILLEKLRKMYCKKYDLPYIEITEKTHDFRAKRITSYLNLIKDLAEKKFEELKNTSLEKGNELIEFISLLPKRSAIVEQFNKIASEYLDLDKLKTWAKENLKMGSIDVNIMTKIDKENYQDNELLPVEFNDAHAALRGYANSQLSSSVILSAGMNPRLYSYIEEFEDFFPNKEGALKKKIVLKVSDYRSALIQGRFLAKKGLWVSEYRVESGLNCGGHAFATDGFLMGPILSKFRDQREDLYNSVYETYVIALKNKNRLVPSLPPEMKITAQGGVGTAEEHSFLIEHYHLDSVGWGSPFLLVPEATTVDDETLQKLIMAREEDLYLSGISPLGVPFNNLRDNTKDLERDSLIAKNRPGSSCPKRYLASSKEFTEKPLCLGSRQYIYYKLKELESQNLPKEEYSKAYSKTVEKSCICVGLGTSSLLAYGLETRTEGTGVSVCPGPNMAYFNQLMSLKQITDHIYGKGKSIVSTERPSMFLKELTLYVDYFITKVQEYHACITEKQGKYLEQFRNNLNEGINYYEDLFRKFKESFKEPKLFEELKKQTLVLNQIQLG